MKKFSLFVPDGMYDNIYQITPSLFSEKNIKGVIFDIDNTVAPYEVLRPTKQMKDYFASLVDIGVTIAFVSNNKNERADVFNEELGFFCVSDAAKPSPRGIHRCIEHMNLPHENVLLVGDQIFTDCLAAHRAKIEFFMVKPIKDKKNLFFRVKRFLEKPFIKHFKHKKGRVAS